MINFFILILIIMANGTLSANFNEIEIETQKLDNGLRIVYHNDPSAPVVSFVMLYKVGSSNEDRDKTGYAHFFEHLMFEETEDIAKGKIDDHIQEAGGTLNAMTTMDETIYTYTLPSHQVKLPLWIESQRMRKLKITKEAVAKEKKVVIEELRQRLENEPYRNLMPTALEQLFEGTTYSWITGGKIEHIQEADVNDFREFYDKYYHPSNAVLAISGDIDIDEMKELVSAYFSHYPYVETEPKEDAAPEDIEDNGVQIISDKFSGMPLLFKAFRSCSRTHKDRFALEILENILVTGNTSRLYKRLVDSLELTSGVYMFNEFLENAGYAVIAVPADKREELDSIHDETGKALEELVQNGVDEKELSKAKNYIERNFALRLKSNENKAMLLASYEAFTDSPELVNSEFEKYENVSEDDIIRVAKEYFLNPKSVTLYSVPVAND